MRAAAGKLVLMWESLGRSEHLCHPSFAVTFLKTLQQSKFGKVCIKYGYIDMHKIWESEVHKNTRMLF